mmetsp:Transcript_18144/g.43634  ORF Transcript_18144/g.43634 Transcript_18144/m.43634 type:complete len:91 (+) Transcript_18144:2098-2370(+)
MCIKGLNTFSHVRIFGVSFSLLCHLLLLRPPNVYYDSFWFLGDERWIFGQSSMGSSVMCVRYEALQLCAFDKLCEAEKACRHYHQPSRAC